MNSFSLEKLIRQNIQQLIPYSSARSEFSGQATILLDANENSIADIGDSNYNRYPDPLQKEVKKRISELKNIQPNDIFLGNGSDEAIDLLIRMCCTPGKDNIIICPPTYGMYEVAAQINDISVRKVILKENFQLDVPGILEQINAQTKLIFICSPNNPTGNLLNEKDIETLLNSFNGLIVIDEAYIDFGQANSWISRLKEFPNMVILQTFSKAWGLAALRMGAAYASKEVIAVLNKIKAPYNINHSTQQIVSQKLSDTEDLKNSINKITQQREYLTTALCKLDKVVEIVYPSDANFLLVKVKNANDVYNYLLQHKVVVRNRSNQPLCDNCLRITIGSFAENEFLLTVLKEYK
ncbi:MAG: histidinol-phosphate transaminase [Bacteroidetes bacterium]|nr:histidinol-phosphate transaminase [Bacteroidota bacterium]